MSLSCDPLSGNFELPAASEFLPDALPGSEASEASYRYLFESNPQPMWIYDSDTLEFLLVNEAALAHYGYSREEFLAMTIKEIRPAEDVHQLVRSTQAARGVNGSRGVWRHRKKNGESIEVEISVHNIRFQGRAARLALISDITERRRSERSIQHMMEGAHCLLWQAEVSAIDAENLRWESKLASEQAAQRFLPLSVPPGLTYSDAWYLARLEEDRIRTDAFGNRETRAGRSYRQEFRCRSREGELRWLAEDVRVDTVAEGRWRCTGVCTDITDRKLAEEAAHTLTRGAQCLLWYAFVEEQPSGLEWHIDTPDEIAAQQFFPVVQAPGQSYAEAWVQSRLPEDSLAMNARGADALRAGKTDYTQQFRCRRADGEWRWLQEIVRVQQLSPGHWHCVGVCTDVTEQKRAAEERDRFLVLTREAEQALRQAYENLETRVAERTAQLIETNERLRAAKQEAEAANTAKSEFLSRMSHELRTPLNAILGFGQLMEKQALTPLQAESLQYMLKGGRHLLHLINEILDIARVEAGHIELSIEPILVREIVEESCTLVRPMAAERDVILDIGDASLQCTYIQADRQRLKQALINLLSNAIKYNRPGGQVRVACCPRANDQVCLGVQDTGPGITPDDQKRLFTPFERLNAAQSGVEGTGLGLVLTRHLVVAMGGRLTLDSLPGEGATFCIELPRAGSPEAMLAKQGVAETVLDRSEGPQATVLYIEDNSSNVRLMEMLFENQMGLTLLTALQGSVGLQLARRYEPDLIVLDVNLPDISGKEVLDRLQASALTRDIPVIILSADATTTQIERMRAAGAAAYLTKPLNVPDFLRTLATLLPKHPDISHAAS